MSHFLITHSSDGSLVKYGAANLCSIPKCTVLFPFLITKYITAVEAIKFNLFLSLFAFTYFFFLYICLKTTEAQMVSVHVMTEMKL
jgi:hypothetical protein